MTATTEERLSQLEKFRARELSWKHNLTPEVSKQVVLGHITLKAALQNQEEIQAREFRRTEAREVREARKAGAEARRKAIQALTAEHNIPQAQPTSHAESKHPHEKKVVTVKAVPSPSNGLTQGSPIRRLLSIGTPVR